MDAVLSVLSQLLPFLETLLWITIITLGMLGVCFVLTAIIVWLVVYTVFKSQRYEDY